jgi:SAM-dependent methyltransferase
MEPSIATNEFLNPSPSNRIYYVRNLLRDTLLRSAQKHWRGARILDYGCGEKPYLPLLESITSAYIGADLRENPHADVLVADTGEVDLPEGSFDGVLSTQVLEHVPSPDQYLLECVRLLRCGGVLILSTHGYWRYHPHPTDFWRWTSEGLQKIVSASGLEILELNGLLSVPATGLQLFQDALLAGPIARFSQNRIGGCARTVYIWLMQHLIRWVDSRVSDDSKRQDAAVFMVIARKPLSQGLDSQVSVS